MKHINSHKSMTSPLTPSVRYNINVIRHASRLLRPAAPKLQAQRVSPRVFCDPRMPGSWHALDGQSVEAA